MKKQYAYSLLSFEGQPEVVTKAVGDQEKRYTVLRGIASTPTLDRDGDTLDPMGAQFKTPMPLLLHHDHKLPVGTVEMLAPTPTGIPFVARIPFVDDDGVLKSRTDEARQSIQHGLIQGVSVGFNILQRSRNDSGGYDIKAWDWYELSLVTVPANAEATIRDIKSADAKHLPEVSESDTIRETQDNPIPNQEKQKMNLKEKLQAKKNFIAEKQKAMADLLAAESFDAEASDALRADIEAAEAEVKSLKFLVDRESAEMEEATAVLPGQTTAERASAKAVASEKASPGKVLRTRGQEEKKMKDNEPGLLFAAATQIKLYSDIQGIAIEEVARMKGYAADSHISSTARVLKAAVPVATTTTEGYIAPLIQPAGVVVTDFFDYLRTRTGLEQLGTGIFPAGRSTDFRKPWVEKITQATAGWVGEGQPKPFTSFLLADKTLEPKKVAGAAAITDEALEDSSMDALRLLRDELASAVIRAQEQAFFDINNAGTSSMPASITYGATVLTPATATGSSQAAADIEKMIGAAIQIRKTSAGLVLGVGTMLDWQLRTARNIISGDLEFPEYATSGTVRGVPVLVSEALDAFSVVLSDGSYRHTAVLFAPNDIMFGRSPNPAADLRVKQSDQATVRIDSDPANSSEWTSLWQNNMVGILVERRTNWTVARQDSSVIVMTAVDWSN